MSKIFCILRKSNDKLIEITPLGFSWLIFFFGPIWAVINNLWRVFSIWLFFTFIFFFISKFFSSSLIYVFFIISSTLWGFFGRDLLIQNLITKNYNPIKLVNASNEKNALLTFLSEKEK